MEDRQKPSILNYNTPTGPLHKKSPILQSLPRSALIGAAMCIAIILGLVAFVYFGGLRWVLLRGIAPKQAMLQTPATYTPVGQDLAELCQTCQLHPDWFPSDADPFAPPWSPPSLRALRPNSISIMPDGAHVEFGGGFYHYGYDLTRDSVAPPPGMCAWIFSYGDESGANRVLNHY